MLYYGQVAVSWKLGLQQEKTYMPNHKYLWPSLLYLLPAFREKQNSLLLLIKTMPVEGGNVARTWLAAKQVTERQRLIGRIPTKKLLHSPFLRVCRSSAKLWATDQETGSFTVSLAKSDPLKIFASAIFFDF
jgi:hypothetical protein